MIIDAQIHIWQADRPDRPWPKDGSKPQLPYPFSAEDMIAKMDESGVDAAVIVPPPWEGNRNDYALESACRYPTRFGVMGLVDLDRPETRSLIPGWRKRPGMLGVRITFSRRQAAWLKDGTADWFWREAEESRIPLMLHVPQAEKKRAMGEIAKRHPALPLIVDHFGLSTEIIKSGEIDEAIDATIELARFSNVYVKVSSAATLSREPYPFRDFDHHIRRVVAAFGARRCFWGTDITKALDRCSYRERVTHFTEALEFLTSDDKEWIMGKALLECLRWKRDEFPLGPSRADAIDKLTHPLESRPL